MPDSEGERVTPPEAPDPAASLSVGPPGPSADLAPPDPNTTGATTTATNSVTTGAETTGAETTSAAANHADSNHADSNHPGAQPAVSIGGEPVDGGGVDGGAAPPACGATLVGAGAGGVPIPDRPQSFLATLRLGSIKGSRSHRWGFGAFLLAELVFLLSSVLITLPFGNIRAHPAQLPVALLVSLAVPTLLSAGVAIIATIVRGNGPVLDLRLRFRRSDITQGLAIGLIGLVITTAASDIWAKWVGPSNANSAVGDLMSGVRFPPVLGIVLFLHLWLIAPLCEEIVYRGLLWGALERWRWTGWLCLAGSTAIFAVAHLEPLRTPLLLVIGLPIGLARMVTGRLAASVVAHSMNNFLPAVGMLLMTQGVLHP